MKKSLILLTLLLVSSVCANTAWTASTADIVFVVDESGSMSGEHAWISGMVTDLEAALIAAGVTNNQYALIGFGDSGVAPDNIVKEYDASNTTGWTTATGFGQAANSLVLTGGTEDGWWGIDYAFSDLTFRNQAATNVILITDEDRDNSNTILTYNSILNLFGQSAILNAVVTANFKDSSSNVGLGVDSEGNTYIADGIGGFSTTTGGSVSSSYGTTKANYIDLAWATGGAAWSLDQLRTGGLVATSFTEAFIDIKVQEIQDIPTTTIPEPATALLFGIGILGLVGLGRKKHMA